MEIIIPEKELEREGATDREREILREHITKVAEKVHSIENEQSKNRT